jgi:nitroimidazol reductase NimA-like FMN-containing flavoprotein (pyridoxamine 5'-phosphate oxidase superfamily)
MSQDPAAHELVPLSSVPIAPPEASFDPGGRPPAAADGPLPWPATRDLLSEARFYWLASTRPDGRPHVRPVLAVCADGALFTTTSPDAAKARNLERNPQCAMTARTDGLDLVVEGEATRVRDEASLQRVADAYRAKYGWPVTVREGAFDAPYGAPTSGPPPYEVYRVKPAVIFGFGTDDESAPRSTRWEF